MRLLAPLFLVLTLGACGQPDSLAYSRQQLELQQQRAAAERAEQRADALEPVSRFAGFAWYAAFALVPVIAIAVALDAYAQRRKALVYPNMQGQLPIPRATVERGELVDAMKEAMGAFHVAQISAAQRPVLPEHLTYSPRITQPNVAGMLEREPIAENIGIAVPSFRELLDRGQITQGAPLILGFTQSGPLTGSWRDLYSSAVAGVSGSGKTTTIRFLACQSALHGARFVVVDPHLDAGDESLAATLAPLSASMLCQPAGSDKDILQAVKLVRSRLDARLHGDKDRSPLVLAVDEFTACMRSSTVAGELASLIEAIGQEGRKLGVYAMLAGQVWTAERAGGTPLRDALASCYVHRIKRRQANMLLQLGDELPETLTLPTGAAFLYRTSGEIEEVRVPLTTADDVALVASLLGGPAPSKPAVIDLPQPMLEAPAERIPERYTGMVSTASQAAAPLDPRAERIRELLRTKTPSTEIIREVWGVSGGRAYQKAAAELSEIVAGLV